MDNASELTIPTNRQIMINRSSIYMDTGFISGDSLVLDENAKLKYVFVKNYYSGILQLATEAINNATDNAKKNDLIDKKKKVDPNAHPGRIYVNIQPRTVEVTNFTMPFKIDYLSDDYKMLSANKLGKLIPEQCFTILGMSSNMEKKRVTIGKNGHGAKCINYHSKALIITSVDVKAKRYIKVILFCNGNRRDVTSWPRTKLHGDTWGYDKKAKMPSHIKKIFKETKESYTSVLFEPDFGDSQSLLIQKYILEPRLEEIGESVDSLDKSSKDKLTKWLSTSDRSEFDDLLISIETLGIEKAVKKIKLPYNIKLAEGEERQRNMAIIGETHVTNSKGELEHTSHSFKEINSLSNDMIDQIARVGKDASLMGIPVIVKRKKKEIALLPCSLKDYVEECFGKDVKTMELKSVSSGDNGDIKLKVILINTIKPCRMLGFVNGLFTDCGFQFNGVNSSIWKVLKELPDFKDTGANANTLKTNLSYLVDIYGFDPDQHSQSKKGLASIDGKTNISLNKASFTIKDAEKIKAEKWHLIEAIKKLNADKEINELKKSPGILNGYIKANKTNYKSTLILGEGMSVRGHLMSYKDCNPDGNNHIGILPLKGVPKNVFLDDILAVYKNSVFSTFLNIMGIAPDLDYSDEDNYKKLKYGKILIATDADEDGSHITGLIITLLYKYWPSLFDIGAIASLITPVVRLFDSKDNIIQRYFSLREYDQAQADNTLPKHSRIKYYKGLGSTEEFEIKDDYHNAIVAVYVNDEEAKESIDIMFGDCSNRRKEWIKRYASVCSEYKMPKPKKPKFLGDTPTIKKNISDFIKYEMTSYSLESLSRAIFDERDGMKESIRKVVSYMLEKTNYGKSNTFLKVPQVSGGVSEQKQYHHGNDALNKLIIKLSQSYVGRGNLQFLRPSAQVGTRHAFDKDSAHPRYVSVSMSNWAPLAFPRYLYDLIPKKIIDGVKAEPEFIPCLFPWVIISGTTGVATGWSSKYPPHDYASVIDWIRTYLKRLIDKSSTTHIKDPVIWWTGYKGKVEISDKNFTVYGKHTIEKKDGIKKLEIYEIPPQYKIDSLMKLLAKYKKDDIVVNYTSKGTKEVIHLSVELTDAGYELYKKNINKFMLVKTSSLTNLYALHEGQFTPKRHTLGEYMRMHTDIIIGLFEKAKERDIQLKKAEIGKMQERIRYINACINEKFSMKEMQTVKQYYDYLETINVSVDTADAIMDRVKTKEEIKKYKKKINAVKDELVLLESADPRVNYLEAINALNTKVVIKDKPNVVSLKKIDIDEDEIPSDADDDEEYDDDESASTQEESD
jgi:DNA gyrase/topoisomerase IV subunit B